jgi:hypothetical protein
VPFSFWIALRLNPTHSGDLDTTLKGNVSDRMFEEFRSTLNNAQKNTLDQMEDGQNVLGISMEKLKELQEFSRKEWDTWF